jgi:hypothetical protein
MWGQLAIVSRSWTKWDFEVIRFEKMKKKYSGQRPAMLGHPLFPYSDGLLKTSSRTFKHIDRRILSLPVGDLG